MNKGYKNLGLGLLVALAACVGCSDDLSREDGLLDIGKGNEDGQEVYNPYWGWVGTFPGWVGQNIERMEFTPVEIKGNYQKVSPNARIGFQETPWFSTQMYAAPGEVVTIVKPSRLKTKLKWRIGAWNCILPDNVVLKRYSQVYESGGFDQDTVRAVSYFGGNIYIAPEEPFSQPERFMIRGAIKSPDYVLEKTDESAWKEEIKNSEVPFAELVGERCVWTMSVVNLRKIQQPSELVRLYDDIIRHDFDAFHGFDKNAVEDIDRAPSFPVRVVQDLQMCQEKLESHPGYPVVLNLSDQSIGLDVDQMRGSSTGWNFFKEVGKNYQTWCWSWVGVKDLVNMLPYYHSKTRLLKAWPQVGESKIASGVVNWEYVISDYVMKNDANKDFDASLDILTANNAKLMPFIQLAQQYGWKLYAYLGKCSRRMDEGNVVALKNSNNQARRDFFCQRVCEYANANLLPFFNAWGIKCSIEAQQNITTVYGAQTTDKFWEKWEPGKLPDEQVVQVPGTPIPDDFDRAQDIDQSMWEVTVYNDISSEGNPGLLIDGKANTYWASDSKIRRPLYDPQPWVIFDMKNKYQIEYFDYTHRNYYDGGAGRRVACERFKLEVRDNENEAWRLIGEFYNDDIPETGAVPQRFRLATPVDGRYLKLTFIRAFNRLGETEDDKESGAVCMAEFSVGGKTTTLGKDPDFPEWN